MGNVSTENFKSSEFLIEVAKGNVPGHRLVHKFGINRALSTEEDIWSYGGAYTWPTTTPHFISSSSTGDLQLITIEGHDENWLPKTLSINLAGQVKTSIGNWYRIFRIKNKGTTNFAGNVYAYEETTVSTDKSQTTLARPSCQGNHYHGRRDPEKCQPRPTTDFGLG